jgi:hypothetical protein
MVASFACDELRTRKPKQPIVLGDRRARKRARHEFDEKISNWQGTILTVIVERLISTLSSEASSSPSPVSKINPILRPVSQHSPH